MARIAFFLPSMAGGGAERVALISARDLIERGHEIDLVLIRAEGELLSQLPAEMKVFDLNASRISASLLPLVRYLRKRKPTVVHAFMWPVTVIAILARILARSRALLMVSDHTTQSQHVEGTRERALLRLTTRLFYPRADVRVACSVGAANDLAKLSGIPRERFEVIHSPISPPTTLATNASVEQMWGDADPRIITVGSMIPVKNQALLLRAFARLQGCPKAKLMILGKGPLRPMLEGLAVELGVSDRVMMPGFVVDPWPVLASADLFVLSSNYEGFPLVLAEAMHAGLKVVSTNCESGPAEMLENGRYGRLVPCGDVAAMAEAMEKALSETTEAGAMRERSMAIAGPAMIARYSDLLTGTA